MLAMEGVGTTVTGGTKKEEEDGEVARDMVGRTEGVIPGAMEKRDCRSCAKYAWAVGMETVGLGVTRVVDGAGEGEATASGGGPAEGGAAGPRRGSGGPPCGVWPLTERARTGRLDKVSPLSHADEVAGALERVAAATAAERG